MLPSPMLARRGWSSWNAKLVLLWPVPRLASKLCVSLLRSASARPWPSLGVSPPCPTWQNRRIYVAMGFVWLLACIHSVSCLSWTQT